MQSVCRFCSGSLGTVVADLGMTPLANSYVRPERIHFGESFFPLKALLCEKCFLVQVEAFESPEKIFSDYAYFSSYSQTWLEHSSRFSTEVIKRFTLTDKDLVVEVASNDGYLLQYFMKQGIPVLGVEPAANVAAVAEGHGVPTVVRFFGAGTARDLALAGKKAKLLVGNNVLAHVPDLNDFVQGLKILLDTTGVISMEFPHLLNLLELNQFDTIYHEHFSYFSLHTVEKIFRHHKLEIFDVQEHPTHGGSLRIFAHHVDDKTHSVLASVGKLKDKEKAAGLLEKETYNRYNEKVKETKRGLLDFLIKAKRDGKTVVGYGAPAKGNTLLNYCGVRQDFLDYTVDVTPAKQGCLLPGTRIPIRHPDEIKKTKPDFILILPWNFKDEIVGKSGFVREWGGKFVVPIPKVQVLD